MAQQMMTYYLKLQTDRVAALKHTARRLSYLQQADVAWQQLVRRGIDMVLAAEGEPIPASADKNTSSNMTEHK